MTLLLKFDKRGPELADEIFSLSALDPRTQILQPVLFHQNQGCFLAFAVAERKTLIIGPHEA